MFQATTWIAAAFDAKGWKYETSENPGKSSRLVTRWNGENIQTVELAYISTDDDNDVAVRCFRIAQVPQNKMENVRKVLNELNNKYRYVKFVVDDEQDVNCEYDLPIATEAVGACCTEMCIRMVQIIDEAYPEIMKALWA